MYIFLSQFASQVPLLCAGAAEQEEAQQRPKKEDLVGGPFISCHNYMCYGKGLGLPMLLNPLFQMSFGTTLSNF